MDLFTRDFKNILPERRIDFDVLDVIMRSRLPKLELITANTKNVLKYEHGSDLDQQVPEQAPSVEVPEQETAEIIDLDQVRAEKAQLAAQQITANALMDAQNDSARETYFANKADALASSSVDLKGQVDAFQNEKAA